MKDSSLRKVKVDDITTIHPVIFSPDILFTCLRKLEKSNPQTIESIRIIVLKKLFEELSYPPLHINEIIEWFEETTNTSFTREELKILLKYVQLYMPQYYQSPKDTINHLVKNCSLASPNIYEYSRWKNDLIKFEENHRRKHQQSNKNIIHNDSDSSENDHQTNSPPLAKHSSSVDESLFSSTLSRMYKFFSGHYLPLLFHSKIFADETEDIIPHQPIAMTPQSIQYQQEKLFQTESLYSELSVQTRKRRYSV